MAKKGMGAGRVSTALLFDDGVTEETGLVEDPDVEDEPKGFVEYVMSTVGSSEMRSFADPYGQKIKLKSAPVQNAGLGGGSAAYESPTLPHVTGQPVALSVFGGA